LFTLASINCPLTVLEDLIGFGGSPAEPGGVACEPWPRFSTEMPSPLLEPLLELAPLCDEASRPADRIAASSSRWLGSRICGGASAFLGEGCRPQRDAADLTEGRVSSEFSLLSSGLVVGGARFLEPKPPKIGTLLSAGSCVVREGFATSLFGGSCTAREGFMENARDFAGVAGFCTSRSSGLAKAEGGFAGVAGFCPSRSSVLAKAEGAFAGVTGFCASRSSGLAKADIAFAGVAGFSNNFSAGRGTAALSSEAAINAAIDPTRARGFTAGTDSGASSSSLTPACDAAITTSFAFASPSPVLASSPPLLFFGPLALPFRISFNGPSEDPSIAISPAPSPLGSVVARCGTPGLPDREGAFDVLAEGGPRASKPASPGLKRAASLLLGSAVAGAGMCSITAGALCCFDRGSDVAWSWGAMVGGLACAGSGFTSSLKVLCLVSPSDVTSRTFSGLAVIRAPSAARPNHSLLARASGLGGVRGTPALVFLSCTCPGNSRPSSFAFFQSSFLASNDSLSSSRLGVLTGPPVLARSALPRVMLSRRMSGATYFSGWVLRSWPNLERNSGVPWVFDSPAGRERRVLRKSVFGFAGVSGFALVGISGWSLLGVNDDGEVMDLLEGSSRAGFAAVGSGGNVMERPPDSRVSTGGAVRACAFSSGCSGIGSVSGLGLVRISGFAFAGVEGVGEMNDLLEGSSRAGFASAGLGSKVIGRGPYSWFSESGAVRVLVASGRRSSIWSECAVGVLVSSSTRVGVGCTSGTDAFIPPLSSRSSTRDDVGSSTADPSLGPATGVLIKGGVLLLTPAAKLLELADLSRLGPNGALALFTGEAGRDPCSPAGLGVPVRGVDSALARSAFALAIFTIQPGCAFRAVLGLGDSGFVKALSIQLDFVGLKRLVGLLGGDAAAGSSAVVPYVEATDLLRLWCGNAGLTNTSSPSLCCVRAVRLLLLEVGRDAGSLLASLLLGVGSSLGMLRDPWRPL